MIERDFDIPFAARLAIREKQIQQNYRPIIAVHKWFARRPGTLFRSLLLSEFCTEPLAESFYRSHNLSGLTIADPFMGGGTPLIEANRVGCDVVGCDINPMAYWIVQEELQSLDVPAYRRAAEDLRTSLSASVAHLYKTQCVKCDATAEVKYFLWVKTCLCESCGKRYDLFPGYLLSENRRHPMNVLVCARCGSLNEVHDCDQPGECCQCSHPLIVEGPAGRGKCPCPNCEHVNKYPQPELGPPQHRLFAIEYYCASCKPSHEGRFFKQPDEADLDRCQQADAAFQATQPRFVPTDAIPKGDETTRLHRWGYGHYRELFNSRQLLGLELSCQHIDGQPDSRIRHALATNLSDLLRYQNMVCRYDTMALKSLDVFSVHGFPVGLIACESNLLGIANGKASNVGSGGWSNIIEKYAKAKLYCEAPFEIRHNGKKKTPFPIRGEWIGERQTDNFMGVRSDTERQITLHCKSADRVRLAPRSIDGVFTDPPYYGNVQYAELMDFCYIWLRQLVNDPALKKPSTRDPQELTVNTTTSKGLEHFTDGLSKVFCHAAAALKPQAPFVFTYHHNNIQAYLPIIVSLLDARLICCASLPCPAEMAASIHIKGTGSSIVDTVFVSRTEDTSPPESIATTPEAVATLVLDDLAALRNGGVTPTLGDARCIAFGHAARLAIWNLHHSWNLAKPIVERLQIVQDWIDAFSLTEIETLVEAGRSSYEVSV